MSKHPEPNILMIVADQLTCSVLESFGGQYGCAPNIDALAHAGVRFERTYTHMPLCQPARAAMWTGLFPHQTGVLSNGGDKTPYTEHPIDPALPTLGKLFTRAGYHAIHIGKKHDMGALAGFECFDPKGSIELPPTPGYAMNHDSFGDVYATQKACDFLQTHPVNNTPYLAVVDLVNPHNICQWIGENRDIENETLSPEDDARLPKLPDNFMTADFQDRPLPVRFLCCMHRRQAQSSHWSKATWRRYIDAYQHYTRMVDEQIGRILATLAQRDDAQNTVVVFTADHGDGLSSHRIATKHTAFYDNITRVPLIIKGQGLPAHASNQSLVSLLDILPTLCDIASIQPPAEAVGRSLLPIAQNTAQNPSPNPSPNPSQNLSQNLSQNYVREFVVSQWFSEWGHTISPGRMVRSDRYKYTHYLEDQGEELFDMQQDPGETRTLHNDDAFASILADHRAMLQKHIAATNDPYFSQQVFVPAEFRAHPSGYEHHV